MLPVATPHISKCGILPQSPFLEPDRSGQPPTKSGHGFLSAILDSLDDRPILDALHQYRLTGRKGYSLRPMWRAYLAKFILKIRYNNQLLERLRGSRKLREVCGFGEEVPSESTLSRFVSRLADHQDLVEQCLVNVTEDLRGLVPAVKQREGRQDQPLPPLGAVVAIDSTLFESYANPNRRTVKHTVSDLDARWGLKNSAKAKDGKKEWAFGYKMHLVSDATHGVPLSFTITPANENDSTQLPGLVNKALGNYPWIEPGAFLADRGYDSLANHKFLFDLGIIPVIHIRKPTADDGLYDGIYSKEGKPVCIGQASMEYVRTDSETGAHLFRCRGEGCPLITLGTRATAHCDSEVWEGPEANLRVLGPLPRFTAAWKRLYRQRMSIERVFRSLKHSRGLERHCVMGMRKIKLLATLSVLTFQATALTRLKAKDPDRMRDMGVTVA